MKKLIIHLPYREEIRIKIEKLFSTRCYEKIFCHSLVPPHRLEYIIGPLTETGVENYKKKIKGEFKTLLKEHEKDYCSFGVSDYEN